MTSIAVIRARLQEVLAKANHVSIFGTPYSASDGAHLIHRAGRLEGDGAARLRVPLRRQHVLAATIT